MNERTFPEFFVPILLLVALFVYGNPFGWWMPNALHMTLLLFLVLVFGIFAGFIWRERIRDEREGYHRMIAGRVAFFAGSAVLMLGIVVQGLSHTPDPWLPVTLGAMILGKVIGLLYSRIKL